MSEFWTAAFIKMKIFLLIFTVYHSQTNDQSKRINQIIEIVFKFHIIAHSKNDWNEILSYLQAKSNNVKQLFINFAFNEFVYDFKINDSFDMLINLLSQDYQRLRQIKRENVKIVMTFASVVNKARVTIF